MIPKPTPKPPKPPKRLLGRNHKVSATVRRKVLARVAVCPWCKEPGGRLDIHHRLPRSRGGLDDVDNLVAVHRKCHRYIHEHPSEAVRRGFTVSPKLAARGGV